VTITGTGLTAATAVKFGSTAAAGFTVASATSITAVSPPSTDGVVDVVVTTPGGSSPRSTNDRYAFTPTVTALSPSSGPAAGATAVIITGTGFGMGPAGTIFRFGPSKATAVNCTSTTTCAVVAPAGVAGSVDVTATLNRVSSPKSAADEYTYN
jgi:hypothetical protein